MKGWLLDTNVLSELRRPRPSARVRTFVAGCSLDELFVSTVTFAEIRFGIEMVSDLTRRAELHDWLSHKVRPMFDQRGLEVSEDVMFKWRLLAEEGRRSGHTFLQPDLIIAATALQAPWADRRHARHRRLRPGAGPAVQPVGEWVSGAP